MKCYQPVIHFFLKKKLHRTFCETYDFSQKIFHVISKSLIFDLLVICMSLRKVLSYVKF